jgi:serine/threonine-protein kinase
VAVLAAPLLLVAGGIVAYAKITEHPPSKPVPDITNRDVFAAIAIMKDAGFKVDAQFADSPRPGGIVLRQRPASGNDLEEGSSVKVAVSSLDANVPDVTTRDVEAAKVILRKRGFSNFTVTPDYRDDLRAGTVTGTTPAAFQRARKTDPFALVVATDPHVKVTNVIGQDQAAATSALQALGLEVTVETASSSTKPVGQVLKTSPSPDETVVRGDTIVLTVSSGPRQIAVPALVDRDRDDAVGELEDRGFAVNVVTVLATSGDQVDRVVAQDPAGGKAAEGSTVTLTVGVRKK